LQQQHGSGKTAVLVERIISKIINEKIDIDKLLVVTFTNAAATEMRERVLEAIYKKIEEQPQNVALQRQILLLNKSNISTIHAFCLEVIRNNFYKLDISPNFRLAEQAEIELIKLETLEELFDELYEDKNKEFLKLINTYVDYRDDEVIKDMVLQVYKYIQSNPFPEDWLKVQVEKFNLRDKLEEDFSNTIWGKLIIQNFKQELNGYILNLENIKIKLRQDEELKTYYEIISEDIDSLKAILNLEKWDEIYNSSELIKFRTWTPSKKIISEVKDKAKEIRDEVKKNFNKLKEKIFIYSSKQANEDIYEMYPILKEFADIIINFSKRYEQAKKEKNIIDFNDIEHYALNLLVQKDKEGNLQATEIAQQYREKFVEIAIDEYQDSNLVQEYILTTISRGDNIFMVGDVKQSIYKFRQAMPELFLSKYETYDEDSNSKNVKIKLFENFRSKKNVLDVTNRVFENIMSKKLGDIEYNTEEFLNQGMEYPEDKLEKSVGKAELNIIDLLAEEDIEGNNEPVQNIEIEAKFVANKIKELIQKGYNVYDKKEGYRKLAFKDIVILLRNTTNIAPIYERAISDLEYPVFTDTGTSYFESTEIQTIMSVLKIIDNPNNDIPLVAILRSPIFSFTDNDLIEIRLASKHTSFYEALINVGNLENDLLKNKVIAFLDMIQDFRDKQEYLKLDELIWYIYDKTGYYNYVSLMTNANIKIANLKMLFEKAKNYEQSSFKGLYNFINFIDKVTKQGSDMGAPKLIGENEDVIRIMSIHKSKGLEFPIVFLCGTGKQFNLQDLNQSILLHQDIGFGPKYINYERKIAYNTLAKEAIKIKIKNEILSEEMRLLYVALTRTREKLIITGMEKNAQEAIVKKEQALENLPKSNKIDINILRNAKSYLDWLEMVCLYDENMKNIIDINITKKEQYDEAEEKKVKQVNIPKREVNQEVNSILNWEYPYILQTKIEGKTSVSRISKETDTLEELKLKRPKFTVETEKISKAELGTTVHLVMQKLDFKQEYDITKIGEVLETLEKKDIIATAHKENIDKQKILNFTKSELFKEIRNAKKVFKEEPFYINIEADKIYENGVKDNILVQGIIDLYFINEKDELILVDYKTDYVPNNDENYLIDKYSKQLELYKTALEQALNKSVAEVYIYSTFLDKSIKI